MDEKAQSFDSKGIRIRSMCRGDLDAVLEIDAQIIGGERSTSWSENVVDVLAGGMTSACLVAELDGKVLGFLIGDIKGFEYGLPRGGWIDIMGVSPRHQRLGIGAVLVQAFHDHCHKQGVEKMYLLARRGDERIESFFGTLGFGDSGYEVLDRSLDQAESS
ncbi:MAG: GNAT family N-acetyltransferase [Dehalococcoidia bacterium]|nr:GNAT family N-acetyltransferase [Dehalococcoidia bacterium]